MHDATEGLRLAHSLQASTSEVQSQAVNCLTETEVLVGQWQSSSCQMTSLAQLGRLWDLLGSASGASEAFYEGKQMVRMAPTAHLHHYLPLASEGLPLIACTLLRATSCFCANALSIICREMNEFCGVFKPLYSLFRTYLDHPLPDVKQARMNP